MMPHVYFLNGPPRAGKDTAGEMLANILPSSGLVKFAAALKRGTHALYTALRGEFRPVDAAAVNDIDLFEEFKEGTMDSLYGLTPRAAYIAVSELLLKQVHGEDFFGRLLKQQMAAMGVANFIVTDSGFAVEARPIIEHFGKDNCTLLRMRREGCSFEGDSRSYLELNVSRTFDVYNNGSRDELLHGLRQLVR